MAEGRSGHDDGEGGAGGEERARRGLAACQIRGAKLAAELVVISRSGSPSSSPSHASVPPSSSPSSAPAPWRQDRGHSRRVPSLHGTVAGFVVETLPRHSQSAAAAPRPQPPCPPPLAGRGGAPWICRRPPSTACAPPNSSLSSRAAAVAL